MSPSPTSLRACDQPCSAHPAQAAGWRCTGCGSLLCPDCTGYRKLGQGQIDSCLRCKSLAHPIRLRRAVLEPFAQTLPTALLWPFSRETAMTAAAVASILWLFAKAGSFAVLIADGLAIALMFHLVRHTARGHDDLSDPGDFRGFFEDVLGPIVRCLVASVWAWGPFTAWVLTHGGFFNGQVQALNLRSVDSPVPVILLLAGTLLFPMSLLAGALEAPIIQLLNPLVVVGYALKLGRDYWLVSGLCLAVSVIESLLKSVLDFVDLHVLGLPDVAFYFVMLFPPFVMFRALGLLVRARGDELGYGGAASFLEPVLGKTLPAVDLDETFLPELPAVAEVPFVPVPAVLELPDELASEPAPLVLARKITSGDLDGAVAVLEQEGPGLPARTLSAQAWVSLSRACVAAQKPGPALLALLRAVEVAPEGPLAPQAFLQAARLADESQGDRIRSNQLLGELVRLHPSTPEAKFAQKRLGRS